jgi:hypothetical protein
VIDLSRFFNVRIGIALGLDACEGARLNVVAVSPGSSPFPGHLLSALHAPGLFNGFCNLLAGCRRIVWLQEAYGRGVRAGRSQSLSVIL